MIKDGRPYSIENGYIDDKLITDRPEDVIEKVFAWIESNCIMTKKPNRNSMTSYGLKHVLDHDTGIYVTNNEFKDAMMLCGFVPSDPNELNWYFNISKKSPALN